MIKDRTKISYSFSRSIAEPKLTYFEYAESLGAVHAWKFAEEDETKRRADYLNGWSADDVRSELSLTAPSGIVLSGGGSILCDDIAENYDTFSVINSAIDFKNTNESVNICVWIKILDPENKKDKCGIWGFSPYASNGHFSLGIEEYTLFKIENEVSDRPYLSTETESDDANKWCFLSCEFKAGGEMRYRAFIEGEGEVVNLSDDVKLTEKIEDDANFTLGHDSFYRVYMSGYISGLLFFNRTLSNEQLLNLFNLGMGT